jgi:hypothetical protein
MRGAWEGPILMPPLRRDYSVHGPFKLEKSRLTFRTDSAFLAQEAQRALGADGEFTVCLLQAEPHREFRGHVDKVTLVSGQKPTSWEIVMTEIAGKP